MQLYTHRLMLLFLQPKLQHTTGVQQALATARRNAQTNRYMCTTCGALNCYIIVYPFSFTCRALEARQGWRGSRAVS